MQRPPIPAELRRAVLVEAGHRCAVPRCGETEIDVHHIVPWERCRKHEYSNLIALCVICHRRVHKGEIDRKSLSQYKALLVASLDSHLAASFSAPIVEIRRRISERDPEIPGYYFEFDFPDFTGPVPRIVSKNLEAWGNEQLAQFRENQAAYTPVDDHKESALNGLFRAPSLLKGSYRVVRNDDIVISLEYILDRYFTGAAHGRQTTRVQNFLITPFRPLTLHDLLSDDTSIEDLSEYVREKLLSDGNPRDAKWVRQGTQPDETNFSRFVLEEHGFRFIFEEYQIDCYAAGRQDLWLSYADKASIWNSELLSKLANRT